jgi:hypothetical protein
LIGGVRIQTYSAEGYAKIWLTLPVKIGRVAATVKWADDYNADANSPNR